MPCSFRRSGNRYAARFHPYMMAATDPVLHAVLFGTDTQTEEDEATRLSFVENKARWNEAEEDHYSFQLDVPGVMANHVTIEETNGEMEVTAIRFDSLTGDVTKSYKEIFYIKPQAAVLSDTRATLKDGVLTIVVPKKKPQEPIEMEIEIVSPPPPSASASVTYFRVTLDLPGVKIGNIHVHAHEDKLHILASRTIGDRVMNIRRIFEIQPSTDMTQARAFLQDGVFTFLAPIVAVDNAASATDSAAVTTRNIPVVEEHDEDDCGVPPSFAFLNLKEDQEEKADNNENKMAVQTAVESDEKEWEQIADKSD